jgi:hypothetical protein
MAEMTNFNIGAGESFKIQVAITQEDSGSVAFDITDYTFTGQVRENYSTDVIAASFSITKILPYISGNIFIQLTPDQTEPLEQRKYVYDVSMASGSGLAAIDRRILEGQFTVRPSATR